MVNKSHKRLMKANQQAQSVLNASVTNPSSDYTSFMKIEKWFYMGIWLTVYSTAVKQVFDLSSDVGKSCFVLFLLFVQGDHHFLTFDMSC